MASIKVTLPPITQPFINRSTGLINQAWYMWFEQMQERTGGDLDQIAGNTTTIATKADAALTITVGNGLTGGGNLEGDVSLAAKQDTGWTAGTGTPNKGADAAYGGQTVSVGYVQAEAQQTDDAAKATAARVLAIEEALRANGAIDG